MSLLFLAGLNLRAQELLNVEIYNQANTPDLPQNVFQRIAVDGEGHIWVGTNGQGIVKFNPATNDWKTELPSHQVRSIIKASNGNILVGSGMNGVQATVGGVREFSKGTLNLVNFWGAPQGLVSRYVHGIAEGPNNSLWVAHGQTLNNNTIVEGGVSWFNGAEWRKIPVISGLDEGLPKRDRRILSVAKVGDKVWVGTDRACDNGNCIAPYIAVYDAKGKLFHKYTQGLPFSNVAGSPLPRVIHHDRKGRTWLGLSAGEGVIAVYDKNNWTVISNKLLNLPEHTAVNFHSIYEDITGAIWIGTSSGLLKFFGEDYLEPSRWDFYTTEHGLPSNFINGVTADASSNIWLATAGGIVKIGNSVKFYHQIENTPSFKNRSLLNDGPSDAVKVSADGTASTLFVFDQKDNGSLVFRLKENAENQQTGPLADKYGYLIKSKNYADSIEAVYVHPTNVEGISGKDLKVRVEVYDKQKNKAVSSASLYIVRPPIVMAHGIFGDRKTFVDMEAALIKQYQLYEEAQISILEYANDKPFDQNASMLFLEIEKTIDKSKEANISAGKVDIICHSMGGLVTRSYLQGSVHAKFKNVNRQITLNTPHAGSQITNLLMHPNFNEALTIIAKGLRMGDINGGAAESMLVDGEKIKSLNNPVNVAKNDVPLHVFASNYDVSKWDPLIDVFSSGASYYQPALTTAATIYYKTQLADLLGNPESVAHFISELYMKEEHDVAVPYSSQTANRMGTSMTYMPDIMHAGSSADAEVIKKVVELLNSNANGNKYSSGGKLTPPDNSTKVPVFLRNESGIIASNPISEQVEVQNSSSVSIVELADGSAVAPNATLKLKVEGSSDIKVIQLVIGNNSVSTYSTYGSGPTKIFEYSVPSNAAGKVKLIALGFNEEGFVAADTTKHLMVNPQADLVSISAAPGSLLLYKDQSVVLDIKGHYSDEISRDITSFPGILYTSTKGLVEVGENGKIKALSLGKDVISVQYLGKKVEVPVEIKINENLDDDAKQAQTINFPQITERTYGDGPFTLTAVASSNLPVSVQVVSGPATIHGNTLTINGAGQVTLRASQAGNDSFNPAPEVDISFRVNKADQTINFEPLQPKMVSDVPFDVSATATSALGVQFVVTSGPATISGKTVSLTGESGLVSIQASQPGNGNFNAAQPVERTFNVNSTTKQSQAITFNALSDKVMGDEPFALEATSSSGLPVSYSISAVPAGIIAASGNVVNILGAGEVIVTASQAGNEMFNAASDVKQSFRINKGSQTITFAAVGNKVFGDSPFELSATASSGLPVSYSVATGPANVSGKLVTLTGEGTVTIKAKQDGNENYFAATEVVSSFCAIPAQPTITQHDDQQLSSSSSVGNQWYRNGEAVEGATAETYMASVPGAYTVQVTGSCGLSSMSGSVEVRIVTGIDLAFDDDIKIYPTPTNSQLNIAFPDNYHWESLSILDMSGKVWHRQKSVGINKHVLIQVDHLPAGAYLIVIEAGNQKSSKMVVVQ